MARVSKIETKLGTMPSRIFSLSTMSASEKRELKKNLEIQLSKVRSTLQLMEEAETKRSDQRMCSVEGENLGNPCGFKPSTPLKFDTGLTTTRSAVGRAGNNKRGPPIGLKDREVKKRKLSNVILMEKSGAKSVVTSAKKELSSEADSSTICCKERGISVMNNGLHKNGESDIDGPSSKKALRAAMLKKRFADTISRAKQKMKEIVEEKQQEEGILSAEATSMRAKQKLKEIVDEKQQKEGILSAEATSLKKIREAKLKMQLQRDREASQKALQEMGMTVEIYETKEIIREVEMLAFGQIRGCSFGKNRLESLGLFLKADYCNEEDEDALEDLSREDIEEGEIVC